MARTSKSHPRPGKHDSAAMTGVWARDLSADLDVIESWGARLVLTLVEQHELEKLQVPHLGSAVQSRGLEWIHLPIADGSVPPSSFEKAWETHGKEIRALLRDGKDIVVHCKGGLGRAGMIAAHSWLSSGYLLTEQSNRCGGHAKARLKTPTRKC